MTINDLFYIICIAVIAFFLLKIGIVILIIAIIIAALYYLFNGTTTATYTNEGFNLAPNAPIQYPQYNVEAQPWYVPVQEYLDKQVNGYPLNATTCEVPQSVSEYCVHKRMQETGDLNSSIARCTVPGSMSATCY